MLRLEMYGLNEGTVDLAKQFECPFSKTESQSAISVLIAEDDPISARILRRVLESIGHSVDHAAGGKEALARFETRDFRLVISDWMMPDMDGIRLCKAIRDHNRPYTYFILLTSRGEKQDRMEAFEAGVDDMLSKPLDRDELMSRLKVAYRILATEDKLQMQKSELEQTGMKLLVANKNLSIASRRFEDLFQNLPVPCFTFDRDGLVQEWNRSAEDLFGIAAYVTYQRPVYEALQGQDNHPWRRQTVRKALRGNVVEPFEWRYRRVDGADLCLVCSIFPLFGPSGETLGAICANVDITFRKRAERRIAEQMQEINIFARNLELQKRQLETLNKRLEQLAITDGLTGIRNFRSFHEELSDAMATSKLTGMPISLIIIDVDHFKRFNDSFGHLAGDEVLKEVATVLTEASGKGTTVARYGGEEFAVLLRGTTKSHSMKVAERIRRKVETWHWPERPITVSLGVASSKGESGPMQRLIALADAALYHSKQTGRNRVTHVDEMPEDSESARFHGKRSRRAA